MPGTTGGPVLAGEFLRGLRGLGVAGEQVEVRVGGAKGGEGLVGDEVVDGLVVALADDDEMARQFTGLGVAGGDVVLEVGALATHAGGELLEGLEEVEDLGELLGGKILVVGEVPQLDLLGAELDEDAVERDVVIDVLDALASGDLVQGGLGDVHVALLDELGHLPVEEGEEKGADVGAVHVGVGHEDDLVVAEFLEVEGSLGIPGADAGADGGDEGADLLVLEDLVEAGLLHVDELAADGEDGLELPVAALLGGAACGVTLDDVEFGVGGVAVGAIGELAGEAAAGEGGLADGLAGLACGLAGTSGVEGLVEDALRDVRVVVEVVHQGLVGRGADHGLDLGGDELDLGLGLELGVGVLDGDDGGEALADVVAGDLGVLVLQQVVGLRILVDGARDGAAEAGQVGAAVGVVDGVGVAEDLVVEAVVVLDDGLEVDFDGLVWGGDVGLAVEEDGLGVEGLAGLVELADELLDAVLVEERLGLGLGGALVEEDDLEA